MTCKHGLYMHFHGYTIILTALQHSHGLSNNLKALVNPYPKKKSAFRGREDALRGPESAYRGYKNLFRGRECAGPGCENACGDRAHCKKRLLIFPSPTGMSLTKLALDGNN
jgi:hypothetical protein